MVKAFYIDQLIDQLAIGHSSRQ